MTFLEALAIPLVVLVVTLYVLGEKYDALCKRHAETLKGLNRANALLLEQSERIDEQQKTILFLLGYGDEEIVAFKYWFMVVPHDKAE